MPAEHNCIAASLINKIADRYTYIHTRCPHLIADGQQPYLHCPRLAFR